MEPKNRLERTPENIRSAIDQLYGLYPNNTAVCDMFADSQKDNLLSEYKVSDNIWSQLMSVVSCRQDEERCPFFRNFIYLYWKVKQEKNNVVDDQEDRVIYVPKSARIDDSIEVVHGKSPYVKNDKFVCFSSLPNQMDAMLENYSHMIDPTKSVQYLIKMDHVVVLPEGERIDKISIERLMENHAYRYTFQLG